MRQAPFVARDSEIVLIVDDNEPFRETLGAVLESAGIRSVGAGSSRDALRLQAEHLPAAVVVDYQLPDGNGIELAEQLTIRCPGSPVVLLTGHASIESAIGAVGRLDAYLTKPVAPNRLIAAVEAALSRRRHLEEVYAAVIVDASDEIVLVNAVAERVFGYERSELLGRGVGVLIPDRFGERTAAVRSSSSADRAVTTGLELYGRRSDGGQFPVEVSLTPIDSSDGTLILAEMRDLTDRRRAESEAAHLQAVVNCAHDAIISKTLDGVITSWNPAAESLYGYSADEAIGMSISALIPSNRDHEDSDLLRRVQSGERIDSFETVRNRKDGIEVDVSLTLSPIRRPSGKIIGVSTIARDIRSRLRYHERLRQLADTDGLTGLRNRRRFEVDVKDQVERSARDGESAIVVLIKINNLKAINVIGGRSAGDRAVRAVAGVLNERFRNGEVMARVDGNEFAILLPYATVHNSAALFESLERELADRRVEVSDAVAVNISARVVEVQIDSDTASEEEVLGEADRAMYDLEEPKTHSALRSPSGAGSISI